VTPSLLGANQSLNLTQYYYRAAYEKTLAVHHPWVVQKAAKLAMNLLPTKSGLVLKGTGTSTDTKTTGTIEFL
jgi:hypothetical protein